MAKRHVAVVLIATLAPVGVLGAHAVNEATASPGPKRIRTHAPSKDSHAERRERKNHRAVNQRKVAEAAGYKKVSSLVNFPTFSRAWALSTLGPTRCRRVPSYALIAVTS